jgi:DNA helicase-2/ATP-dependent DNA helicase PcrA
VNARRSAAEPSGRYLRTVLDTPFTDEQLQIITHPLGPQLVVAGAGSGKTTVMAARVVHVVAHHRVPPAAVLGLTFTNKAARELAARVRSALARVDLTALGDHGRDPGTAAVMGDEPTVATYHAYAARLFADHALRIGREPAAALLTEAGAWQLALRAVRAASGPFRALDWRPATVARYLLDLNGEMAEHLVSPDDVRGCDARLRADVERAVRPVADVCRVATMATARDELVGLVEDYRARKRRLDLVDFGDQITLAAQIARSCPDVRRAAREQFRVVLLDEYQDTGVAQRILLAALFGGGHPVTAVGDPCQSIYGWRGASVGNLLRFGQHFADEPRAACRTQYLMTNFRSGGRILALANDLSRPLRQSGARSRRPALDVPVLEPTPSKAASGEIRCGLHHTVVDEAAWVADEVVRVLTDGVAHREVAVLCRRRADFPLLHRELTARDVPVEVVGLGGLLTMPEVADVVAALEVLADPTANAALLRLLTGPRWRIGPRDLVALGRRAGALLDGGRGRPGRVEPAAGWGTDAGADPRRVLAAATAGGDPCDVVALADALEDLGPADDYSPPAHARMSQLAAELAGLRPLLSAPVVEVVTEVIRRTGLDVEIVAAGDAVAAARSANLGAFLAHASGFVGIGGETDLAAFLAFLAAARDAEDGLDVGGVSAADTVKLMTVHKAKGLEWEVVVVAGLTGDVFPSSQSRLRWTGAAKVLPYELRGDAGDLPEPPEMSVAGLNAFARSCKAEELDEERRLAYVAFTRAKRRLVVSGYLWGATQQRPKPMSPFLAEVRSACRRGAGEVVTWCAEPAGDNPLRAAAADDVDWPPGHDEAAFERRVRAAELVRQAMAAPAADAAGCPDTLVAALSPAQRRMAERWTKESDLLLAELAEQAGGVRDVALPRALTASQVVRLADDPGGLAAELARPMPRRPNRAAQHGTRFHAWVEQLFAARPLLTPDDVPGAADAEMPPDEELRALQEAFARSPYAGVRPHAVEAPFEATIGGWLLRGRIDAVYRTNGGYDVVDYKTGPRPRNAPAAALQLAVYRVAWAGIAGVPLERVGAAFLYVRTAALVRPADLPDAEGIARLLERDE